MTDAQKERIRYFKALENLIISFGQVQEFSYRPARSAIQSCQFAKARLLLEKRDPAETMRQFSHLSQIAGGDRGEEAMVISLGTRWVTDYIAARQAAGLEAIRIDYGPTNFEPLAQGAGNYSYHIDREGQYWSVRGNKETKQDVIAYGQDIALHVSGESSKSIEEIVKTGIVIDSAMTLTVSPIVDLFRQLVPGHYLLTIYAGPVQGADQCKVSFMTEQHTSSKIRDSQDNVYVLKNGNKSDIIVTTVETEIYQEQPGIPQLQVVPEEGKVVVYGLKLRVINVK